MTERKPDITERELTIDIINVNPNVNTPPKTEHANSEEKKDGRVKDVYGNEVLCKHYIGYTKIAQDMEPHVRCDSFSILDKLYCQYCTQKVILDADDLNKLSNEEIVTRTALVPYPETEAEKNGDNLGEIVKNIRRDLTIPYEDGEDADDITVTQTEEDEKQKEEEEDREALASWKRATEGEDKGELGIESTDEYEEELAIEKNSYNAWLNDCLGAPRLGWNEMPTENILDTYSYFWVHCAEPCLTPEQKVDMLLKLAELAMKYKYWNLKPDTIIEGVNGEKGTLTQLYSELVPAHLCNNPKHKSNHKNTLNGHVLYVFHYAVAENIKEMVNNDKLSEELLDKIDNWEVEQQLKRDIKRNLTNTINHTTST